MPMLFGPSRRTPSALARATRRACRAAPCGPASAKPSLKTLATGTPRAPQSSIARSTSSTMMNAWSTLLFYFEKLLKQGSSRTTERPGLTGTILPA